MNRRWLAEGAALLGVVGGCAGLIAREVAGGEAPGAGRVPVGAAGPAPAALVPVAVAPPGAGAGVVDLDALHATLTDLMKTTANDPDTIELSQWLGPAPTDSPGSERKRGTCDSAVFVVVRGKNAFGAKVAHPCLVYLMKGRPVWMYIRGDDLDAISFDLYKQSLFGTPGPPPDDGAVLKNLGDAANRPLNGPPL